MSWPLNSQLRSRIEAVLLVSDSAVTVDTLARALGSEETAVQAVLEEVVKEFDERSSGFELRETAEGWRLYSRAEYSEAVEKFLLEGSQTRLSRAALETLAVVAYRQPVTRSQISAIRGVNVDGVMRTLVMRGLIVEVEAPEQSAAHHYATTELFLELLGIDSLDSLPSLAPLLPEVDTIDEEF